MRDLMAAVLVISVALLCVSSSAFRPTAFEEPFSSSSSQRRSLQQDAALSNSNGCLDSIPKCEQNACATRNIMGVARWVCLRCLGNYEAVVDSSGQDNIVQCVCPRGTYEAASNATDCTRCPVNSYCTGGDRVGNPSSRGSLVQCGSGLVTRNTGARSAVDCVAPAGFAMTSPAGATPCGPSEYAPKFNRLQTCLKCQGGLEEEQPSLFTDGQRTNKKAVCKVPPGKYMSQGLVRQCPQGFYRANYEPYDAAVAQLCLACNPGITTNGAGAKSAGECNKVLPGYGIDSISGTSGANTLPTLPVNDTTGLPAATVCELGFYSQGGYCVACPENTVTRVRGAKSVEECAVPPGYWLSSGSMVLCPNSTFREGWLLLSDSRARNCTRCGEQISSEPRDLDVNPLATNGSLVPATSASCYIEAGQGMVVQGRNSFKGLDCPVNTYGVAGRVYGWAAAPCKPCPRNMVTNIAGATSIDACINPGGYGYASEGASRCSPGFYAQRGSLKPCQKCPEGRTTQDNPDEQQSITDCNVAPGHGVTFTTGAANGDIFQGSLAGLSEMDLVSLGVLVCPTGYYGGGDSLAATCTRCPEGSTTKQSGSTVLADCSVCIAGRGRENSTAPCTPCKYGFWQPGGLAECLPCPTTTFYPPVDGLGETYTTQGNTFSEGATGVDQCVPMRSQLSPEAGQAYFTPEMDTGKLFKQMFSSSDISSLPACLDLCASDSCCLAQYNVKARTCLLVALAPAGPTDVGPQIFYKLPSSEMSAALSVKDGKADPASVNKAQTVGSRVYFRTSTPRAPRVRAGTMSTVTIRRQGAGKVSASSAANDVRTKTLASGMYARCTIADGEAEAWLKVGSQLTLDARTFAKGPDLWLNVTDVRACQEMCDNSNVCWGGIYRDGQCLFRGGIDALNTRAFFALPSPDAAHGLVNPTDNTFYFTFTAVNTSALSNLTPDQLSFFETAVHQAIEQVSPYEVSTVNTFPQIPRPGATGAEYGFEFVDASAEMQLELTKLLVRNETTTKVIARNLLAMCMAQSGGDELLFSGLMIASSDGAQVLLEPPILIDGCDLVADFCSPNGNGACTLNKCGCTDGWTGYRCTEAAAVTPGGSLP